MIPRSMDARGACDGSIGVGEGAVNDTGEPDDSRVVEVLCASG